MAGWKSTRPPENQVIAHRNYPEDRRYSEALSAHYRRGTRKMWAQITGSVENIVPTKEVAPDLLIDEHHAFELGGRRFEILWTPGGETRSAVIVWLSDEKIAIVGNLFGPLFGNQPNLNTIRGDKPLQALQFIDSIKKLRALKPELVLTGHEDIHGAEHIEREITRIIDSVQWVHDRTVEGMNAGIDLSTLMREVKPPPELTLTEEYGKVSWNVRAIWHEYTGWFDPARGTTELYGVPPSSVAPAIVELAGGGDRLAERARAGSWLTASRWRRCTCSISSSRPRWTQTSGARSSARRSKFCSIRRGGRTCGSACGSLPRSAIWMHTGRQRHECTAHGRHSRQHA